MTGLLIRRLLDSAIVIWLVVTAVFVLSRTVGDPVREMAPLDATNAQLATMRHNLGLDDPLAVQYVRFLGHAVRLDFGRSIRSGQGAMNEVGKRLPATAQLGGVALLFSILLGLPLGVLAAVRRGGWVDVGARFLALIGQAVPNFWLGLMLIMLFAVQLKWLPTSGRAGPPTFFMPVVTLGAFGAASICRLTRAGLIDSLKSDFVRTARAKGLHPRTVVIRHAARGALLPIITLIGVQLGTILTGSVIVETVFAWPGVGRLMIQAINGHDYPVVQAGVVMIAVAIVIANAATDLLYGVVDPRSRAQGS